MGKKKVTWREEALSARGDLWKKELAEAKKKYTLIYTGSWSEEGFDAYIWVFDVGYPYLEVFEDWHSAVSDKHMYYSIWLHAKWLKELLDEIKFRGYEKETKPVTVVKAKPKEVELKVEAMPEEEEKEYGVPEGVTVVEFDMENEAYAKMVEDMFMLMMKKLAIFKSPVNLGTMVRTVMYEAKDKFKTPTPIKVFTVSNEMAWSLQQTIDWVFRKMIEIVAVKRVDKKVKVAYVKRGIEKPPREYLYYHFKKTDGWSLVSEPKH